MAKVVTIELEAKTGTAYKDIGKLEDSIKDMNQELVSTGDGLANVDDGAKKASKGIKGVGVALKAAGVGLVIAALSKLKEIFEQNQTVADGFSTAFEFVSLAFNDFANFVINNTGTIVGFFKSIFEDPLGSIQKLGDLIKNNIIERFNSLLDTLGFAGEAVAKFFKGDFAGAAESAKAAATEFVDVLTGVDGSAEKIGDSINKAAKATKEYVTQTGAAASANVQLSKSAEIARIKQQGLIETYDRQAEKLRQIRDDDTKSIEDRIKANDDLKAVLDEQTEAMLAQVQVQIDAAQAQYKKNASQENYIALLEAQQEEEAVLAQIEGFRSEQISNRIALERERDEEIKEKEEEDAEKAEEKREKEIEDAEFLEELEQKKRDSKRQTVDTISNLVNQETALGKAALLAKQFLVAQEFILNAKSQISNAKKALSDATTTGAQAGVEVAGSVGKAANSAPPPWNAPFIVSAIATGAGIISSVKSAIGATKSAASQAGAGGGGAPSLSAPTASASAPPAFNIVGASGENQLAETIAGQTQRPIKTFVTSQDVTTSQSLERNIVEGASI
jgi:hypothetical protein